MGCGPSSTKPELIATKSSDSAETVPVVILGPGKSIKPVKVTDGAVTFPGVVKPILVETTPPAKPLCSNGCGKPTWNGKADSYCSHQCKCLHLQLPRPRCKRPGCSGHSFNWGKGNFCTMPCRSRDAGTCIRPGCNNGALLGEFCSAVCSEYAKDREICVRLGCGSALRAGTFNAFCSPECEGADAACMRCGRQASTGSAFCAHEWCSNGHIYVQRTLKDEELCRREGGWMLSGRVDQDLWQRLTTQFKQRWDSEDHSPQVRAIYHVDNHKGYDRHIALAKRLSAEDPNLRPYGDGHAEMPGNMKLRYHGTLLACDFQGTPCKNPICSVCNIIKHGFDDKKIGSGHGQRYYGDGIYCSSSSATAYKFSRTGRAVFAVSVVCGDMFVLKPGSADRPVTGKHHVMVVKNPDNHMPTAVMKGTPHKHHGEKVVDELVVFTAEAIHAKYLFILEDREPGAPKCANYPRCYNRPSSEVDKHGRPYKHCNHKCAKLAGQFS